MSVSFYWSSDVQRFTKSITLRISGSHYTLFQVLSFLVVKFTRYNPLSPEPYGTFPDSFFFSVTAYSVYQKSFALSRTFFNLFFRFSSRSFSFPNFSGRRPFRSSLFSISNPKLFVKNFFLLFSAFSAAHFRSSFTILYPPPLCQVLPPPFFL